MLNVKSIESRSYTTKGQIPEIMSNTVSRALNIAGLNEEHVDNLVEDIKRGE